MAENPVINPLDAHVGYQLRRASGAAMAALGRRLAALDLRPTDASILVLVEANPLITQSRLGQALGVQRANMAPLTGGLLLRELIVREPIDRKSHGFRLTQAGAGLTVQARAAMAAHEAQFFGGLSAAERILLADRLANLAQGGD